MNDDLISRAAAIQEFNCCELTPDGGIDVNYAIDFLEQLPPAQPDTYEALRILDAINSSGRLDYGDYCDLHDAISEIGGAQNG